MGNESRYDQYDLNIVLPEPLVPRHLRLPVPERLDNEGNVLLPLDERGGARAGAAAAARGRGEHRDRLAARLRQPGARTPRARRSCAEELPGHPGVAVVSDVSPEMREWERFSTTVANAYVQPLMARYLRRLEDGLRETGLAGPLFLMLSGGGLTTIETACRFPIRLVESGPAGGAIFSATIARQCGLAQRAVVRHGRHDRQDLPDRRLASRRPRAAFEVARVGRFRKGSGLPLRIPVIEMVEIGAGGGSIAHVDSDGPHRRRAGERRRRSRARPATAAAAREPAVTDANLVLGRYDPARFAGGTMRLDAAAAHDALAARRRRPSWA